MSVGDEGEFNYYLQTHAKLYFQSNSIHSFAESPLASDSGPRPNCMTTKQNRKSLREGKQYIKTEQEEVEEE